MSAANLDFKTDSYLFKAVYYTKKCKKLIKMDKPLSYTRTRECFLERFKEFAPDLDIGLHSLRSGGATEAANKGASGRCLSRHGRWKSVQSRDRYIEDSLSKRLDISKSLNL